MRYDFQCNKCGIRFEHEKRMKDPAPPCPKCGLVTERFFGADSVPSMLYANRPPWTYNDIKKARRVSDGKNSYDVDGTYGDISSINRTPPKAKKAKKK